MTFKHNNFQDSPVMRSLERVAVEKGLVKSEPIAKIAAVKTVDLTPTVSLTENIVKLCIGLREKGLNKYAEELEFHLLSYKKAQTLYETSPEKGEDLIEFAHPNGSHKLENVDGDEAVFEDILDRQLKMLEVVNKKPTGKLSSRQAIHAVKIVLADDNLDRLYAGAADSLDKFKRVYTGIIQQMGDDLDTNRDYFNMIQKTLDSKKVSSSGWKNFENTLTDMMDNYKSSAEPSYLAWGRGEHSSFNPENTEKWQSVQKYFPILKKYADRFEKNIHDILLAESGPRSAAETEEANKMDPEGKTPTSSLDPEAAEQPAASNPAAQMSAKLSDLFNVARLNAARITVLNVPNKDKLATWLTDTANAAQVKQKEFESNKYKSDPIVLKQYQQYYDTTNARVNKVQDWVKQQSGV